jgi:hypothetical protein
VSTRWPTGMFVAGLAALLCTTQAGELSGTVQSTRLYTEPDAGAGGGLRGKVHWPQSEIRWALAINANDITKVYKGTASGPEFSFTGLPIGKYDIVLGYAGEFYEGITLTRDENTLAEADVKAIETIINRSVPFFDLKKIHRLEGTGGKAGVARCVLEELRTKPTLTQAATEMVGIRPRSIKVATIEEVGAGWQLTHTREFLRTEAGPQDRQGALGHEFRRELQGIRVANEVKDLGLLNFRAGSAAPDR